MNLTVLVAPVASVALLFGSIGVATLTGDWVTSGRQQVVAGQALTVDDLKGWMTLQQTDSACPSGRSSRSWAPRTACSRRPPPSRTSKGSCPASS